MVRSRRALRFAFSAFAGVLVSSLGSGAFAQSIDCSTLPAPVYGIGGSSTKPLLGKLAAALSAAAPPQTLIYQSPGACVGFNTLADDAGRITGTASYWGADGKEQTCTLPTAGVVPDFANMGNTAPSCPGVATLPADIGDFAGPVNTYNLIVPKASSQTSISADAAYFVFGFGADGKAAPWTDNSKIFRRDQNSAAQLFVSIATGVPAGSFKGVDTKSNSGTVTAVATSTSPEAAIGLVSGEVADANRATVRTLAYQHRTQTCGVLPDSTETATDKKNVRSGKYYLWSPQHFFAKIDGNGAVKSPGAAKIIGYFTGDVAPPPNLDLLRIEIQAGTVPKCAMRAWRKTDLGPLEPLRPSDPCGCLFDAVASGSTTCAACSDSNPCTSASAPVCRHGYCEER